MPNIGTLNVGRELTHEEVDMVAGGLMTRGSDAQWDVKEGLRDLSHGNPEGWLDIIYPDSLKSREKFLAFRGSVDSDGA